MAGVGSTPSTAPRGPVDGALRQLDYWSTVYLRTWKGSVVTSFVSPLLYVLAMGVLLGGFIEGDPSELEGATSYLDFVAPGLLAAQAMTIAFGETTYPVMGMIKWQRIYYSMIASPLSVAEVLFAQFAFVAFRTTLACVVFVAVMAPFGVFASVAGALGALVVQVLLCLAFATPVLAFSAGLKDESGFSVVYRLGLIPLFLFSGAFFPVANLGTGLEVVAKVTPLWHGVDLTRMLTLGQVDWSMVAIHLAYLVVLTALGRWWSVRRLSRRLIS